MKDYSKNGTKCLLVQPKFSDVSFWNYIDVCKIAGAKYPAAPLGMLTVAGLLPQQWKFKLIDENVEPLLSEHFEWADIVGIGGMLPQQNRMLSIINRAHSLNRPVVVGGSDPTSQPHLYQSADYLVRGEGENSIPLFLQDLEKGCKGGDYTSAEKTDMTKAGIPRFDLINFKNYIHVGIQYSRGCPYNCEFCDIIELFGRKSRTKTPEQIINELQTLYDLGHKGHIDFVDDNFIGDKQKSIELLSVIKEWMIKHKHPFYFSTESSINLADDDKLLQLMKDIDFRYIFIGIETPDDDILKSANKKINLNKSITNTINKINSYGIIVNAGFIIGFDNETDLTADHMIQCIQDSGICMAMIGKLYALPCTQLERRLIKEGRMFNDSSHFGDVASHVDQLTSGLNFLTIRPRVDILKDYKRVIESTYDPIRYFERVIYTSLHLKTAYKYRPGFIRTLKTIKSFYKLCMKLGFNKITGRLFWKTFFTVLFKNIKAVEAALNLAAMYIHFYKQSRFIIEITNEEIKTIENVEHECERKEYKRNKNHKIPKNTFIYNSN